MTALPVTIQAPARVPAQVPAQAPAPPPIPALPGTPGAATGAGGSGGSGGAEAPAAIAGTGQGTGFEGLTSGTGIPFDPQAIIREAIPIVGMTLSMIVVIFIGWPLARAFARRLDRRTELGTVSAAELLPQLRQLQESIDTMAVELERISESQRFQAKLMAERPQALPSEQKRA